MELSDVGLPEDCLLLSEADIQRRVVELAREIEVEYADRELLIIGVLGGAAILTCDLTRALRRSVEIDWIAASSYGAGTKSSGVLRITKGLEIDTRDRHLLIVDDILDTGLTMSLLASQLANRGAATVEACVLLRKPDVAKRAIEPRFVGFDIGDDFAVGYGLDHAGKYRNLRCIAVLPPEAEGA